MGYSSNTRGRVSITSLSLFFIIGGILLYFVNEEKGKEEAKYLSRKT
jgi:UMF1 family MFS transporter